jgi:dihydroorotase
VLGHFVREANAFSLSAAIRKMSLMPAQRLQKRTPAFARKGRVKVGADADLTIFDPARVIDRSTYKEPALPPEGIVHVLVNGTPVVSDGKIVPNVAPGRPMRAPKSQA